MPKVFTHVPGVTRFDLTGLDDGGWETEVQQYWKTVEVPNPIRSRTPERRIVQKAVAAVTLIISGIVLGLLISTWILQGTGVLQ